MNIDLLIAISLAISSFAFIAFALLIFYSQRKGLKNAETKNKEQWEIIQDLLSRLAARTYPEYASFKPVEGPPPPIPEPEEPLDDLVGKVVDDVEKALNV